MPAGDYVSQGLWVVQPDAAFPHMRLGDPRQTSWPYMRRDVAHNWYVDERQPSVGFVNRDEASVLYNTARLFVGRRCLEIGCWHGWSTVHLAAGCGGLEVIDPVLADADWRSDVEESLAAAGVQEQVRLFPLASPQGVAELAARDPTPWSLIFIDGDHEGGGPRRDAEMVVRFAAEDAIILLHDLLSPAVADALAFLRGQGWRTMIYNTAQVVGVAWRGEAQPLGHVGDPKEVWRIPAHLSSFLVSGESAEVRAERLSGVIERLAEGDQHPGLGVDPVEAVQAAERLQALTTRNQELAEDLTALRDQGRRLGDQLADLRAERDSYFAYYTSHNEAKAALAEREARLDRLREEDAAARETLLVRTQALEEELRREQQLKDLAVDEGDARRDLAEERNRLLGEALLQLEQIRSKSAADGVAIAEAVRERARLKGLAVALQGRLEHLGAQREDVEAQSREAIRLKAEQAEHFSAALDGAREQLSEQLDLNDREIETRRRLEAEVKRLERDLREALASAEVRDRLHDQVKRLEAELEAAKSVAQERDRLKDEVRRLGEDTSLAEARHRVQRLEEDMEVLLSSLDKDGNATTTATAEAELGAVRGQLERRDQQISEFDARIVSLEREMAERVIQVSWLEHEREQIAAERDRIKVEVHQAGLEPRPAARLDPTAVRVAEADVERLSRAWAEAEVERDRFRAELHHAKEELWSEVLASRAEVESLRQENTAIRRSETWRMTAPLRALIRIAKGSGPRG